jgi:hypothetical protein
LIKTILYDVTKIKGLSIFRGILSSSAKQLPVELLAGIFGLKDLPGLVP